MTPPDAADNATTAPGPAAPLVSVLVRSLDRPFLQEALASVAAQTHPAIEVVVVAVHPGHAALPSHCGPHPLRLLPADAPRPRSLAANVALDAARGQYLLFLDDDDWLMPGHISRLVQVLQAHPQAQAAYAGVALVDLQGRPKGQAFDLPFDAVRQLSGNLTPIHAVLFSAALRDQGCRFDEALDRYEDWDFWIQVARHTVPIHVDGVSAVYRIHESSGVHEDGGAASLLVYQKWRDGWTPQQLAGVMQRVWRHADLEVQLAQRDRHLAELQQRARRDVEQQAALVSDLSGQLGRRGVELQVLTDAHRALVQTAAEQAAVVASQLQLLQQQQRTTADLSHLLETQVQQAEGLRFDLRALRDSTSWRLTAPLRALKDLVSARSRGMPTDASASGGLWARGLRYWRLHGTQKTLQRWRERSAAMPAASGPMAPQPPAAALSGSVVDGHAPPPVVLAVEEPVSFVPMNFYVLPLHGQHRVSLVVDVLRTADDERLLEPVLLFAARWANAHDAQLRVIARLAAPSGPAVDRILTRHVLQLRHDSALCHAPADDGSVEFDLMADEMLFTTSARNLASVMASVRADQIQHWLDPELDPHPAPAGAGLPALLQHAPVRVLVPQAQTLHWLARQGVADLGERMQLMGPWPDGGLPVPAAESA